MRISSLIYGLIATLLWTCTPAPTDPEPPTYAYPDVVVVGAMRNVMWQGELAGSIDLDTLTDRSGLYGLGPLSYLRGELLVSDGRAYVSRVESDSTMTVEETFAATAPFFVYGRVHDWETVALPDTVTDLRTLAAYLDQRTRDRPRPFAFKLSGPVTEAQIHVQNLPPGTTVSSPAEAHQGQVDYLVRDTPAEIVGFFSTAHQGVFTHHDSFVHAHLITADHQWMGHLDAVTFPAGGLKLYLPVR
jgi:acetolactate decarboxylase